MNASRTFSRPAQGYRQRDGQRLGRAIRTSLAGSETPVRWEHPAVAAVTAAPPLRRHDWRRETRRRKGCIRAAVERNGGSASCSCASAWSIAPVKGRGQIPVRCRDSRNTPRIPPAKNQ